MSNPFFDHPILNSPYEYPRRHWELDSSGQPTQRIVDSRRRAEFITPISKPKKRKKSKQQDEMVFDEGKGLSTKEQQYDPTSVINEVRQNVDQWRALPSPNQWQVTPETTRLLQHWRHHKFSSIRPFFCQVEAAAQRLRVRLRGFVADGQRGDLRRQTWLQTNLEAGKVIHVSQTLSG